MTKQWGYVNVDKTAKPIVDAWVKVNGALKGRTMWFEKQLGEWVEVLTVNEPSIPLSITVPDIIRVSDTPIISWGASVGVVVYCLERSVNGNAYEEIYRGTNRSCKDTIGTDWETVRYRVRAYNNAGYSGYRTSKTVNIRGMIAVKDTIVAWSGTIKEIPAGWYLCDGNNGTPNLVGKFVRGTVQKSKMHSQQEKSSHSHTCTEEGSHTHSHSGGTHYHTMLDDRNAYKFRTIKEWGSYKTNSDGSHSHTVSSNGSHSHIVYTSTPMPEYYKLAFIMKG